MRGRGRIRGARSLRSRTVRGRSMPRWVLPLAGGLLFASIVAVVLTSAIWWLDTYGAPPSGAGY
ncbi:MAG: DUF6529 family protein [Nocardioidaceae bacterium]